MKNLVRSGPLLHVGAAFVLSSLVLFYATNAIKAVSLFSGIQFMDDENNVVPYPTPLALWALPTLLLAVGIVSIALHASGTSAIGSGR